MKCGLLPLSQESCLIGDVSYHSYNGIVIDPEERQSIARDLGPSNKVQFKFPVLLESAKSSKLKTDQTYRVSHNTGNIWFFSFLGYLKHPRPIPAPELDSSFNSIAFRAKTHPI